MDDGSPDKSGEIADEYLRNEKRIKVVHQQNAGLGPARNSGMAVATGEYIGFIDSDDWTQPEMFERLYEAAVLENADIAVSGHQEFTNGRVTKTKMHPLAGTTIRTKQEIESIRKNLYGHSTEDSPHNPQLSYSCKILIGILYRSLASLIVILNFLSGSDKNKDAPTFGTPLL